MIKKIFQFFFPKKQVEHLIIFLQKISNIRLIIIAYKEMGILKYQSFDVSGESFFLEQIVKPYISSNDSILDIGANVGEYTRAVKRFIPGNRVISVEAIPTTFNVLKEVNADSFNYAVTNRTGDLTFYTSATIANSTASSISKDSIPNNEGVIAINVTGITLIQLVKKASIESIGFLKIDVEGDELAVLKSGLELLPNIKLIQFEFNEKQIYTRSFLRDYYDLLSPTHDIFRLNSNGLIDLREYLPINEIFIYQNIVAIQKGLVPDYNLYFCNS